MDHRKATHIKTIHERSAVREGILRRETWSLVEDDGERRVLFEAREAREGLGSGETVERRIMTVREALREPRSVARQIWLSLEH